MRFSTLLGILLASINFGTAKVLWRNKYWPIDCFDYGERWEDNIDAASAYSLEACNKTIGNRNYTQDQKATACYNIGWELRVDFTIVLRRYPPRFLTYEECVHRMKPIFFVCTRGGKRKFYSWEFKYRQPRSIVGFPNG